MSSEIFESKEDEFKSLFDIVLKKLTDLIPKLVGEERKKQVRDVERNLEDAALMIQDMEEELKRAPNPFRMQMISRIRSYKSDLGHLTQKTAEINKLTSGRENRTFPQDDDFETITASQRSRLLARNQAMSRTSESIARSQRVAAETDDIGHNIIGELGSQREQLTRTRDRLIETDEELSKSRRILKGIGRRVITSKVFLIFVIVLEVIILGGIVYWKFFS